MEGVIGTLKMEIVDAANLTPCNEDGTADAYCRVQIGPPGGEAREETNTRVEKGSLSPKWLKDASFTVTKNQADVIDNLSISVYNDDGKNGEDGTLIGFRMIRLEDVMVAGTTLERYKLTGPDGNAAGEVCLIMRYVAHGPVAPRGQSDLDMDSLGGKDEDAVFGGMVDIDELAYDGNPIQDLVASSDAFFPYDQADTLEKHTAMENQMLTDMITSGSVQKQEGNPDSKGNRRSRFFSFVGAIVAVLMTALAVSKGQNRKPKYYEVQEGDTLCGIAGCYNLTADLLYEANVDVTDDPDRIYPGDRIFIP